MAESRSSNDLDVSDLQDEEDGVYAQLAMAAEFGKALLEQKQDLQARYDQIENSNEELCHKIEDLKQENYEVNLELEKAETQHQNTMKDLQDELASLKKLLKASDQTEVIQRDRSRSLREAQEANEYLEDQLRQATGREEEVQKELNELNIYKCSNDLREATQMDHIAMLREQVDHQSYQLQEMTQTLQDVTVEREGLAELVEGIEGRGREAQCMLDTRDQLIERQVEEIKELKEAKVELQQRVQLRSPGHLPFSAYLSPSIQRLVQSRPAVYPHDNDINKPQYDPTFLTHQNPPQGLMDEVDGSKSSRSSSCSCEGQDVTTEKKCQHINSDPASNFKTGQSPPTLSNLSLTSDSAVPLKHRRNYSDGSICSSTEGSRKRHHATMEDRSDREEDASSRDKLGPSGGCKQTLYSKPRSKHHTVTVGSEQFETSQVFDNASKEGYPSKQTLSLPLVSNLNNDCLERGENMKVISTNIAIRNRSSHHEEDQDDRMYSVSMQSNDAFCMATMSNEYNQTNDKICNMLTSPCSKEKSLLSELSPHMSIDSPFPQEQSLFSELCSHLNEAKGLGTDAGDLEDDPFTESHKRTHRLESQMSCYGDWSSLSCVTADDLIDDFECDDDDDYHTCYVGESTALSTGSPQDHQPKDVESEGARHIPQHSFYDVDVVDQERAVNLCQAKIPDHPRSPTKRNIQGKITIACAELAELLLRLQGHEASVVGGCSSNSTVKTPDDLLDLISHIRLCINKLPAEYGQISNVHFESLTQATFNADFRRSMRKSLSYNTLSD